MHELINYLHLWGTVDSIQLAEQPDKIIWRWTMDRTYSAKSAYNMMHFGSVKMAGHRLI